MFYVTIIIAISAIIIISILLRRLQRDYIILALCRRVKTLNGVPIEKCCAVADGKTIFGNSFDILSMNEEQLFYYSREYANKLKRSYIEYVLGNPFYNIIDAGDADLVLSDPNLITKGFTYRFLQPFLKTGLLTSTDKKWHMRRKLLTPTFHFNILSQFLETFKFESAKFIRLLEDNCTVNNRSVISLSELIPRFTLNNICETALGVKLDERLDGDEYRDNISKIEERLMERIKNPFMVSEKLYNLFGAGKTVAKYVKKLHDFSSNIIKKRRQTFNYEQLQSQNDDQDDVYFTNRKNRYAMLDTLLRAERDGLIDHAGICEEVDTFMFEGFDTTSMNLIFALMNLALYPEVQEKCYQEINEFIDDDLEKLTIAQLSNLKYVECFIKETQRLYPSVPAIIRECTKDTKLENNLLLPKGTQVVIHIFDIHRNPKYYDEPEEFRPERFTPENSEKRHPFAFIPFSAGQRNCIGQKFAILEIKALLVYVIKNFKLLPITDPKTFRFLAGILIRSRSDIKIEIVRRVKSL